MTKPHYCSQLHCFLWIIGAVLLTFSSATAQPIYSDAVRVGVLQTSDPVTAVVFSPDGQLIAGGYKGKVSVWDTKGALKTELKIDVGIDQDDESETDGNPLEKTTTESALISRLLFFPNSKKLIVLTQYGNPSVWNIETGQMLYSTTGHSRGTTSVAISPDGKTLATGGNDQLVKLWDAETGKLLETLKKHLYSIRGLGFSRNSKRLTSFGIQSMGNENGEIRVWDVEKKQLFHEFNLSQVDVMNATLSPYGDILVSGGVLLKGDRRYKQRISVMNVWNLNTTQLARQFEYGMINRSQQLVAFSSDEDICLTMHRYERRDADRKNEPDSESVPKIRSLSTGESLTTRVLSTALGIVTNTTEPVIMPRPSLSVALSPSKRSIAFGCANNTIEIWLAPESESTAKVEE